MGKEFGLVFRVYLVLQGITVKLNFTKREKKTDK